MKSVADKLLEAAVQRGQEREEEVGCKASPLDHTIYVLEIAYERGFVHEEAHDVAEVIQDIWEAK